MDRALLPLGAAGAVLLSWLAWRVHKRRGLPGSVEPEQGGLDEAPAGSADVKDDKGGGS